MSETGAPRGFGGLLALLGLVLACAGVALGTGESGAIYFIVVGALVALSGLLIFNGKKLALVVYGITLAVVWGWSLKDSGGDFGQLLPRVALPTLFGLYIFSDRIRSRLGR